MRFAEFLVGFSSPNRPTGLAAKIGRETSISEQVELSPEPRILRGHQY